MISATIQNNAILSDACVYLSGPIQSAKDHGVLWRKEFTTLVRKFNIPIQIIDPCNKQHKYFNEIGSWRTELKELKANGDFDEVERRMKRVRRFDLRACDLSDFLIVLVDMDIPTWGTTDEMITVERQQKPILAIVNGGQKNAPDWVFAIVKHQEMFEDVESCVEYLHWVNSGEIEVDDRWVLIRSRV
tara:strand:- start:13 stop:576 length:564 start_codon:yes stop_codon:yes gene_type:complete